MGSPDRYRRTAARSASGIFAGAALVGTLEGVMPGGNPPAFVPSSAALACAVAVWLFGARLPRSLLWLIGPIGAVLAAFALKQTGGSGDGAMLYSWPVIWVALYFGNRATAATIASVAIAHAYVLTTLPSSLDGSDRFIDVLACSIVIGAVVRTLVMRNTVALSELAVEARVDPLTGLLNRRGFEERYERAVARARRDDSSLAVVALDLDHFKELNDVHGHETGDRVLQWVGSVLTEHVRGVDIAARIGGEEFLLVLPHARQESAREVAERIRVAIADPADGKGGPDVPVTVSAGVAAGTPDATNHLIEAADLALYDAKRNGRDRVALAATPAAA